MISDLPAVEALEPRQLFASIPVITQTNLVSDGFTNTPVIDANLVNAWGMAIGPTGNIWVANNGSGTATIYRSDGSKVPPSSPLVVTIPLPATSEDPNASPTGQVLNPSVKSFKLAAGKNTGAQFIFDTEQGTIAGWNPNVNLTNAVTMVDDSPSGAIFKGLAIAGTGKKAKLYATDFHNGQVDVFNQKFQAVTVKGNFADPNLPSGFAPFGIQNLGGKIYVTYAMQDEDAHDEVDAAGLGVVDVFNTKGELQRRLASNGTLNAPWGVAKAPKTFGAFKGDILVGNFGDGRINVFTSKGKFKGQLADANSTPIAIDGLWALTRGTTQSGDKNDLFFSAGPNGEDDGLFGKLAAT